MKSDPTEAALSENAGPGAPVGLLDRPAKPRPAVAGVRYQAGVRAQDRRDSWSFQGGSGYLWAALSVALATGLFWIGSAYLDNGQASLLYLPVVLTCAWFLGFGPAVAAAILSFLCWNFFFLPPRYTFTIADPRDWLSLIIFLLAAVITARLASKARSQADAARAREIEIATLHEASVAISQEVGIERLLPALAAQLRRHCGVDRCVILRESGPDQAPEIILSDAADLSIEEQDRIRSLARSARDSGEITGLARRAAPARTGWSQPVLGENGGFEDGVYVPLRADGRSVGVLHLGPRQDCRPFSPQEERIILTLANHAAVGIARHQLAVEASQAAVLREADLLKDTLMSLVSHELRTPLAAIKATASGLVQPDSHWEDHARQDAIASINTEADRLSGVVSNLLDLSRLEAGAWKPQKDWCDMIEIVGTALDRFSPALAARIRVCCPTGILLKVDYTQIALVLTNLLENALKYSPASRPVDLQIRRTSEKGNEEVVSEVVRIITRDYGPGLAPGEEETIFERFTRSVRHVNSSIPGAGLGLALCRAIVTAHGGRIWAANAPAGESPGAIFNVMLAVGDSLPSELTL